LPPILLRHRLILSRLGLVFQVGVGLVDFAAQDRLRQPAEGFECPPRVAADVLAGLGAGEPADRLVSAAAIAAAAGRDQIALAVAPAVRLTDQMVEGDIGGVGAVQVPAAIQAVEAITQINGKPLFGADPLAGSLVLASSSFLGRVGHCLVL